MSRLESTNPSHVEVKVLYHPSYFHGASILLESMGDQEKQVTSYDFELTRLLLSFQPMHGDPEQEETLRLRPADMARIRKKGFHRSTLTAPQQNTPPKTTETIKIFEAGGMIVYDQGSQRILKAAFKDERRPEGNKPAIDQATKEAFWICCNPSNFESHGKVGMPVTVGICVECTHDKCPQCFVAGGITRNSIGGREVHSVNPVEKYALAITPVEPLKVGGFDEGAADEIVAC
jgi:hypothetical protein